MNGSLIFKKAGKFYSGTFALLLMVFTFSSCLNNDDNDGVYTDFVSITSVTGGGSYFVGSGGEIYTPAIAYVNDKGIKAAFIQFKITKDESTSTQKKYTINLLSGPISLDRTVNAASTEANLDSLKNDSIIQFKTLGLINDNYLLTIANYYFSGNTKHYFTLCYVADKGFVASTKASDPDTLKVELRHNANKDVATQVTSQNYFLNYNTPKVLYQAFDIGTILNSSRQKTSKKNIYIDIRAKTRYFGESKNTESHSGILYTDPILQD